MTIQFLKNYKKYQVGDIATLQNKVEFTLIKEGIATLSSGVNGQILSTTYASLPPANLNTGKIFRVTDLGSGGMEMISDGNAWRPRNSMTVVSQSGAQGAVFTGTTSAMDMAVWNSPGGLMGPNGKYQLYIKASYNSTTTNTKYLQFALGSTVFGELQSGGGTNAVMSGYFSISNRGAMNSQVGGRLNNSGFGVATGSLVTGTEDTSTDKLLRIIGWLPSWTSGNGDFIRIEEFSLILLTPA